MESLPLNRSDYRSGDLFMIEINSQTLQRQLAQIRVAEAKAALLAWARERRA